MKAIIDGKRYDTATATVMATTGKGYSEDFHHWAEELYKTPKGAYFLMAPGEPLSRYAQKSTFRNERYGSRVMIPMTIDDAKQWLEENATRAGSHGR
jgi:hypothetical protein